MSLYFFSKLDESAAASALAVHSALPFGAYAIGNVVNIITDDGEVKSTVTRASSVVSVIAWHPTLPVLAIGWQDGNLSIWNRDGPEPQHAGSPQHDSKEVSLAAWFDRSVLCTVGKGGNVVLWQYEAPKLGVIGSSRLTPAAAGNIKSIVPLHGTPEKPAEDPLFLAISTANDAFLIDESNATTIAFSVEKDTTINGALWSPASRLVVVLSSNSNIYGYHVAVDNVFTNIINHRISVGQASESATAMMVWAQPGLVAMCAGDDTIRFFNVEKDVMYLITVPPSDPTNPNNSRITTVAASKSRGLLAAATRSGRMVVWSFSGTGATESENDWSVVTSMDAPHRMPIERVFFSPSGAMFMTQGQITSLLQETPRIRKSGAGAVAVQIAPDTAVIISLATNTLFQIKNNTRIKALDVSMPVAVVHTGKQLEVYTLEERDGSVVQIHSVDQPSSVVAAHSEGILTGRPDKVAFVNLQLSQLQAVNFSEAEGVPSLIDVMGDFVAIVSNIGQLKLGRISSRDVKIIGPTRRLCEPAHIVTMVRVNARGKKVLFMRRPAAGGKVEPVVYVFDMETDSVASFNFETIGLTPVDLCWNRPASIGTPAGPGEIESLLIAAEVVPCIHTSGSAGGGSADEGSTLQGEQAQSAAMQRQVLTLFASSRGIFPHHNITLPREVVCLAGCAAPNLILCLTSGPNPTDHRIELRRLRDYEGMAADADAKSRDALMQFAYCTAIGNMDEAYRVVKTVKDPNVWTNLARMCVSTGRMDVAEVCLANMQDFIGARALHEAREESEPEVAQATLAMALGMLEDAEKLLKKCNRQDMLTELYIGCGKWDVAIKHAEVHDRIRILPTLYRYAQHLEATGNIEQALKHYTRAKCYAAEGPRLLFAGNRIEELKVAVARSDDKDLLSWWAQYLESINDTNGAFECYKKSGDGFNMVRILTSQQPPQIDRAMELVSNPDLPTAKGAAFFIARHFEEQRNVQQAMHFYDVAGAYKNALRLAKESDMYPEIVALSLKCGDKHVALESATFFEERGIYDKAAQLYQKGGDSQRAIDVCVKGGLYDELHRISESLDAAAEPETFIAMAEHLIVSGHFAKAVQMLVFGKAFNEALQLCIDHNVKLTDEMAEAMTLPKTAGQEDEEYRLSLLKKIAKVAKAQESWYLACKKYTQAGERVKAMKMLLRSGDTERIIFFANHSRMPEIYILAANFLQSQNWQNDTNIYKCIVSFYTKAKSFDQLAGFYDACAQLQVDEYRDYDKALATLREAQKALDKGDAPAERKDNLRRRVAFVETFVNARSMIKPGEPCPQMVEMCTDLLNRSHRDHVDHYLLEQAVRVGDIYALLVEYYDKLGQAHNAFALIEKMQAQEIELSYFLENTLIDKICKAVGHDPAEFRRAPPPAAPRGPPPDEDDIGVDVDEEVV